MKSNEKKKKFQISKKTKIIGIVIISIILLLVIGLLVYSFCFSNSAKESKQIKMLNTELEKMGKDFYENYLYPQIDKEAKDKNGLASILGVYKDIGITVNLETLGVYNNKINSDKISKFINHQTKEVCNKTNTFVKIYPKGEYGKNDYTLEVKLDCGYSN